MDEDLGEGVAEQIDGTTAGRGVGSGAPARDDAEGSTDAPSLAELAAEVGEAPARKLHRRLRDAAREFGREHFDEARRELRALARQAPGAPSVRELHGLTLYRLGRWREAARELEAFRELTGSVEQHPVLADCYRALGRYGEVERLWDELREVSPGAELVTEGRIVMAGAVADQGRVRDAIGILGRGWRMPREPREHHLRRAYALADLYERSGDLPAARALFARVEQADPRFGDVRRRVRALE